MDRKWNSTSVINAEMGKNTDISQGSVATR